MTEILMKADEMVMANYILYIQNKDSWLDGKCFSPYFKTIQKQNIFFKKTWPTQNKSSQADTNKIAKHKNWIKMLASFSDLKKNNWWWNLYSKMFMPWPK